ncbi:MAG: hypothetical protein KKC39_04335 [Candidatus Omnitrophica bacterium]|nr:hypothetical protein [Candidatus Omnitrophota bacterium]MBU4467950.1 hypothetical protein [Candidatus Omnitrophota bacterium]
MVKVKKTNGDLNFEAKLWQAADKMRNNMDATEYKHVVLETRRRFKTFPKKQNIEASPVLLSVM